MKTTSVFLLNFTWKIYCQYFYWGRLLICVYYFYWPLLKKLKLEKCGHASTRVSWQKFYLRPRHATRPCCHAATTLKLRNRHSVLKIVMLTNLKKHAYFRETFFCVDGSLSFIFLAWNYLTSSFLHPACVSYGEFGDMY